MNFVKPNTIWVKGRCYRTLACANTNTNHYIEDELFPEEDTTYQDELDCGKVDIPVEQLKNGRYSSSLTVANTYYSYIIGGKGATKRRIETDTSTQIKIPSKGKTGDIVIQGMNVKSVRAARLKIELLVDQAKKKQPFTHFLSMPVISSDIQEGFITFKENVLDTCSDCRGVDSTLFQVPTKLHMTLCVMVLTDDRERLEVVDALEACNPAIIDEKIKNETLELEMRGIEYMNDDPGEVDVLYGKVNCLSQHHDLQEIADAYVDHLAQAGIIQRQYEKVKLHVTLMNTLFRKDAEGAVSIDNGSKKERETFDARRILENFKDFYFGKSTIDNLQLSVRFTTSNIGYYTATKIFSLL